MASISWARFREVVKAATRGRARFVVGRRAAAMVYISLPLSDESDERGLWELAALANPRRFPRCPAESQYIPEDRNIVRGYRAWFHRVKGLRGPDGRKVLDWTLVRRMLPDACKHSLMHEKALRRLRAEQRETEVQRKHALLAPRLRDLSAFGPKRKKKVPFWRRDAKGFIVPERVAGAGGVREFAWELAQQRAFALKRA